MRVVLALFLSSFLCALPLMQCSSSLNQEIFSKQPHVEAVFWGVKTARAILDGQIPPSSYSNEMEIVGAMESLVYGLRNFKVVVGEEGEELHEINDLLEKVQDMLLCHVQHRADLYTLKGMASDLLELASDIIEISETLSSPTPFSPSFFSSNLPKGIKNLEKQPSHTLSFSSLADVKEGEGGSTVKLPGVEGSAMPLLGFGTWRLHGGEECERAVKEALNAGFRRIDTAYVYGTERCIGEVLKGRDDKNDIFLTTKIPDNEFGGYNHVSNLVKEQLKLLGREKIDMYMLHGLGQDKKLRRKTWKALEALVAEGLIDHLGVSNANIDSLKEIASFARIQPSLVQNKLDLYHPGDQMVTGGQYNPLYHDVVGYCRDNGIVFESYSSLSAWPFALKAVNDPIVKHIGKRHNKNPAQVVLRAHLQSNLAVIPRSANSQHIQDNFDVFDFELSAEEMVWLRGLRYLASSPLFAGADTDDNIFSVDPHSIPTSVEWSECKHPKFRVASFTSFCHKNVEIFWVNPDDGSRHGMGLVGAEPHYIDSFVGHQFAASSGEDFYVSKNKNENKFKIACPEVEL